MKVKTAIKQAPTDIAIGSLCLLISIGIFYFFKNGFLHFISIITLIISLIGLLVEIVNVIHLKNKARKDSGYLDKKLY